MSVPVLTHAQSGPMRRMQAMETVSHDGRMMPPPAMSSSSTRVADLRSTMGPPATPGGLPQRPSFLPSSSNNGSQRFVPQTPSRAIATVNPATSSRTFVITPQHKAQHPQRFLPSSTRPSAATAGSSSGHLVGSGAISQAPSRSPSIAMSGSGGQRAPFVPGTAR
ncbi:hypothetical protein OH76DRAFT_419166 [Lentinus brumalis]|uniref:Uncharacterized protein n=1 Tax=Lentinus brumalis TaxID=2498619 RepID=A0A371DWF7_9APHY|nr:hypothetical protein OH76DRAFT_419166 [Polyporus brumalis]